MAGIKVLLVDDEKQFVDTMTKRLEKRGLQVTPAYDGEQALAALGRENCPEIVVLDVKMPGMDGIEALRRIKAEHPLTEVIMLTGHATVESAIEGMKLGAFDYLMKPCDIELLVSKVREASARRQAHEEKIIQARIKEITTRGR
jgi:DNA-binding NtrC family response regulator